MNYGRYQIVSELGRGSMGVVYQAHDPQIDRLVALKVLREDRLTSKDYVQRFLKEATAIGRLSHPGIVTVYDVGQDHGTIYIAMEFLEGQPLDQLVSNRDFRLRDIVKVGVQVARALHYAHKKGIVHRDIKPPNIIYTEEGTIKVTDFGIAHIDDPDGQQMTRAGEILGTPVYMAPEQVMGQPVDGRSDLYSLGVILYELTTGRRPFQGENLAAVFRAITQDDPIPPDQLNPDIPPTFSRLILKTMARQPEDRFASGKELAELLESCLDSQTRSPSPQPTPEKRRSGLGLLLIGIFLLVGTGLAVYLYLQPPATENRVPPVATIPATEPEKETDQRQLPALPPEEKIPGTAPALTAEGAEKPGTLVTVTPSGRKIKRQSAAELPPLPEPEPAVESEPAATPGGETKILPEQAAELIDELFTEDKQDASLATPADTDEPKWPRTPIPEQDNTPTPVAPKTGKIEVASLPPSDEEQKADALEKLATLKMNSRPKGAKLYLNGDYKGLTPIELEITATKHEVKLELQGHLDWKAQLDLSKGGEVPLSIRLLPE